MAKIMLIGCGDVGMELANKLVAEGHDVRGVRRTWQAQPAAINFIQADITKAAQVEALDLNVDQLVYILSPEDRDIAAYKAVFETGVDNLLNTLKRQQPTLPIMFISSTRVYAQQQGEWVNESSTTEPTDERGRILFEAEGKFLAFNKQTTVVRFSGIYGRSNFFINQLKKGAGVQKEPPYYTNRIHREDCVGVLEFLLTKQLRGESLARIYLASDHDPAEKWDVANYITNKLGLAPCGAVMLARDADRNKRIDNRRLIEAGYEFKFVSYKEGYGESINERG